MATFTNVQKSTLTTPYTFLIDATYFFLIDSTYKFEIGDGSAGALSWTNQIKN